MKSVILTIVGACTMWFMSGCDGFLDEYSVSEVRPTELTDIEQLLLGDAYLDANQNEVMYNIMDIFTDDIQCNGLTNESFRSYFEETHWRFLWDRNMFDAAGGGYDEAFWELPYNKILGCNIVLDCLDEMTGEESLRENLRGEALVLRALYYLQLVNMYGMPYNEGNPAENLGVPLKLTMDVRDERLPRNTVGEVYAQIESDLLRGNELLTANDYGRNFLRISHLAAKALLSRVYLYMEDWDRAIAYADSVLAVKPDLLDLNTVNWQNCTSPSPESMSVYSTSTPDEVIWMREGYREIPELTMLGQPVYGVSDELLDLYGDCNSTMVKEGTVADLRGCLYFAWYTDLSSGPSLPIPMAGGPSAPGPGPGPGPSVRASYRGYLSIGGSNNGVYQGIRTAEMYLNRAEGYVHKYMESGDASYCQKALADLNELRRHRFNDDSEYEEVNITASDELCQFLQEERRRELAGDWMHRWCDLRRYGMPSVTHVYFEEEGGNATVRTITKNEYVLPIAEEVIRLNPRLEQNN